MSAAVAYVSGHGLGHLTRLLAVLAELPALAVHLRSSGRALAVGRASGRFASAGEADVGPGVAQRGPLEIDLLATRAALARHLDGWDATVEAEARFVRGCGANLVLADLPPIAPAIARAAGVPSAALGNFSWSWIYQGYAARDPWFEAAAARLAAAEAEATLALELAMGGGMEVFPRRAQVPPIAARVRLSRDEARARLVPGDAPSDPRPIVLASFGGFGGELDLARALARPRASRVVCVGAPGSMPPAAGRFALPGPALSHPEMVLAADCLIGKPGYGTVAECLRRPTAFVHVPRGEFREAPLLEAAIARWLPSAPLDERALLAGEWDAAIEQALAARPPEPAPAPDGAIEAAARVTALLD